MKKFFKFIKNEHPDKYDKFIALLPEEIKSQDVLKFNNLAAKRLLLSMIGVANRFDYDPMLNLIGKYGGLVYLQLDDLLNDYKLFYLVLGAFCNIYINDSRYKYVDYNDSSFVYQANAYFNLDHKSTFEEVSNSALKKLDSLKSLYEQHSANGLYSGIGLDIDLDTIHVRDTYEKFIGLLKFYTIAYGPESAMLNTLSNEIGVYYLYCIGCHEKSLVAGGD